jgi:hypothetical protein
MEEEIVEDSNKEWVMIVQKKCILKRSSPKSECCMVVTYVIHLLVNFVLIKDFFDATLACDDEQIQAHKLIISACSPYFRNVLRRSPHQNPEPITLPEGCEVHWSPISLELFLADAKDIRLKGLTQNQSSASSKYLGEEYGGGWW